jgi:polygalacturonase
MRLSRSSLLLAMTSGLLFWTTGCAPIGFLVQRQVVLDVRARGAVGDGKTTCTAALQKTLDQCAASGGGVVLVPAGNYLTGAIQIKSNTTLYLAKGATLVGSPNKADYPLATIRWEGRWRQGHRALIWAENAKRVAIDGPGRIVGSGPLGHLRNPRGPALIEPILCNGVFLKDFSTQYERMWSIHPTYCKNVVAYNLAIRGTGGNSDGIDVDSCKHVLIENCDIDTGDDAIAIKSGRGMEGYKAAMPSEDVTIASCTLGDAGFACIGIGSEASGGIRDVTIERCRFAHARSQAIYIKSNQWRGSGIENVVARDLIVGGACGGFLRINLLNSGKKDEEPVVGDEGIPYGKNFRFSNVRLEGCGTLLEATEISDKRPIEGLVVENVTGTCKRGMTLTNAKGVALRGIDVAVANGPLLRARNVEGQGLEGAVPYAPPPALPAMTAPMPAPAARTF